MVLAGAYSDRSLSIRVVLYSGSVVLLGDTIYNFGDTLTAIPLWIASLIMAHIHLPDGNF